MSHEYSQTPRLLSLSSDGIDATYELLYPMATRPVVIL